MAGYLNVCRFRPTAGGTTDWTFSAAVVGYSSPALAGVVNGATYRYRAESADMTQWEIGTGVYNTGTGVLTRATVLANSSGTGTSAGQSGAGTKINFSAIPQVAIVALKEDVPSLTAVNSWTDTTEATGAGTTAAALFAGGVEIAKKLFVAGAVALTTTLTVGTTVKIGTGADAAATPNAGLLVTSAGGDSAIAIRDSVNNVELFGYAFSGGAILGTITAHQLVFRTNNIDRVTIGTNSIVVDATILSTTFSSTSAATSTTTGAVRVNGGLGVVGAAYIGGALNVTDTTASSSLTTGSGIFAGGVGISGALTAATLNTSGAGASLNLFDRAADAANTWSIYSQSNALRFYNASVAADLMTLAEATGVVSVLSAAASSSITTGALVVTGGVGIGSGLNVGSSVTVAGNVVATRNDNSISNFSITNNSAGVSAAARYFASNGTNSTEYGMRGTAQTTYGALTPGCAYFYGITDFVIMADAGASLIIASGGSAERARFLNGFMVGGTTDPGAGCARLFGTTATTSTTTGTLIVGGGLGLAGDLWCGANGRFGNGADASSHGTVALYVTNAGTSVFAIRDSTNDIEFSFSTNTASGGIGVLAMRTNHPLWVQINASNLFSFNANGSLSVGNTTAAATSNGLNLSGIAYLCSATATPAGGSTSARLIFGTTAGFGIYYGSGAPTVTAAAGSLYIRTDNAGANLRLYSNTTGAAVWAAITSA